MLTLDVRASEFCISMPNPTHATYCQATLPYLPIVQSRECKYVGTMIILSFQPYAALGSGRFGPTGLVSYSTVR